MRNSPPVTPYTVTMLPSGSVDARPARAQDFGGDGGLGQLGQGLENVGSDMNAVQQDQARIWASTAIAQAEVQTRQKFTQQVNSLDPTAPDYPDQIGKLAANADDMWTQATSDLQAKAPTNIAGRMVASQMSRARVRFTSEAMDQQAKLNAGYTTNMVLDGVKASSDLLAASPDNDTYQRLVAQSHDSIVNLQTIDPNVKLKLAENTEHQLAVVQAESFASQHPTAFLQSVNAQGGVQSRGGSIKGAVPTLPGSAPAPSGQSPTAQPSNFLSALPAETQAYVPSVLGKLGGAAPLNADGTASQALVHALIGQESAGNPNAVSGKGAKGLMQVMPATASSMGLPNADLTDPAQNVSIGTAYLNQQLKKYHGDVPKALAAYNAGPGAVDRALATVGTQAAAAALPQVQPLTDQQIAAAKVPLAGWDKLTWGEKVQTVRQAEGLLGKNLADDRGATSSALQDAMTAIQHGLTPQNLDDPRFSLQHLQSLYGPEEGQRKRTELDGLQETAQAMKGLATMPDAQAEATIRDLYVKASGDGAAVLAPAADRVANAYATITAQRRANPLASAAAYGLGGYKDLDWSDPSKLQAGLPARVATARTMMQEFNTVPQIFTQQDVAQAQVALTKLAPADRVNYLAGIVRGVQDKQLSQVALHQIYPKGDDTMLTAVHLALTTGGVTLPDGSKTSNRETADMVAEGYALLHPDGGVKPDQKNTDNPAGAPLPVGRGVLPLDTKKFDAAFNKAVGGPAAFGGPNADYSGRVAQETYNAVKAYYVADAMHNRADVSNPDPKGIEKAVTAVTGGVWHRGNGDALFAPQGMPMQQFTGQFAGRAAAALKAAGYDDRNAAWQFDHAQVANWGDGRYVFMSGGRPLVSPTTGKVITVDYSQPYTPDPMAGLDPNARAPSIPLPADAAAALQGLGR